MRLLLTARALELVGDRLAGLPVQPVVLDGTVEDIDVAWATGDL